MPGDRPAALAWLGGKRRLLALILYGRGSGDHSAAVMLKGERRLLASILAMALTLGAIYAVITPTTGMAGPDEGGHFDHVKVLWETRGDRSLWSSIPAPAQNSERHQPDTYYWLVSPGYALTRGQPEAIQMVAIRLASVILFLVEIVLAYLTARQISPANPFVYLGTTAMVGLLPGRLWMASMINNDNLAAASSAAALWLFVRFVRKGGWKTLLGLATALSLALGSKQTAIPVVAILLPITAGVLVASAARVSLWALLGALLAAIAVADVAFFALISPSRLGLSALNGLTRGAVGRFETLLPAMLKMGSLSIQPFIYQYKSFWLPLWRDDYSPPDSVFQLTGVVAAIALVGLAIRLVRFSTGRSGPVGWRCATCLAGLILVALAVWMASALMYAMGAAATPSFTSVRRGMEWPTHARYFFPALVPIAYLLAAGLGQLIPSRLRNPGLALLCTFLLYLNGVAIYGLISTNYWWPS